MFLAAICTLCGLAACGPARGGAGTPEQIAAARRLAGTWDVRLQLDTRASAGPVSDTTANGTIALLVGHRRLPDGNALRDISNVGVYDLELEKPGWGTDDPANPATAVGRAVPAVAARAPRDSIDLVLSPGSATSMIWMSGTLEGDSVRGRWTAGSFRTGGGAGRFIMRRRPGR